MATIIEPWHFAGAGILVDDDDNETTLSALYNDTAEGRLIEAAPELVKVLLANRRVLLAVAQNLESGELLGEVNQVIGRTYTALKKAGAL